MSKTYYTKPAEYWIEGQPLGNGRLGAMVCGGVKNEKITLNDDTLWSGHPRISLKEGAYEAYCEAKKLVFEENYHDAHMHLAQNFLDEPVAHYLLFGDMDIEFEGSEEFSDYGRTLDLDSAVVTVAYTQDGTRFTREYFCSKPADAFVIKLTADKLGKISFKANISTPMKGEIGEKNGYFYFDGICPDYINNGVYEYPEEPEKQGVSFRGGFKVKAEGGTVESSKDGIAVKNADSAVIVFSVLSNFNGPDKLPSIDGREYINVAENTIDKVLADGYEKVKSEHISDYTNLYNRVKLDLGTSGREDMPTDERLDKHAEDHADISLYTLMFDFGRYLTIAGSREGSQAMNLQGIWNNSMTPPWRSDYTVNINTEMNYWPTLGSSLPECFEPMIDLCKKVSKTGIEIAKHYYHANGFVLHHNTDLWGNAGPMPTNPVWGYWSGGSGWLCRNLFDYYEYTLDKDFLRDTCYPIMKEAARCYLDLLCERGDGHKSICPSTSPENMFTQADGQGAAVAKYTTMSDCIAYDLFKNCLTSIEDLGICDDDFKKALEEAVASMDPMRIGKDGRLLEWTEDVTESAPQHRHISHIYPLHPAHLITKEKTPELVDACLKTLEVRGDDGTGWSLGWKINVWARLDDGNHAKTLMDMQLRPVHDALATTYSKGGTFISMLDAHPPFQIDGNFGFVSGMLEMLADVRNGKLVLLPALPDEWKNGSIKGMRVRGGKIIDITWENGKVKDFKEYSAQ